MTLRKAALRVVAAAVCCAAWAGAAGAQSSADGAPMWIEAEVCTQRPLFGTGMATNRQRARSEAFSEWEGEALSALTVQLERRYGGGQVRRSRRGRSYEIAQLLTDAEAVLIEDVKDIGGALRCEAERRPGVSWRCEIRAAACAPYARRAPGAGY